MPPVLSFLLERYGFDDLKRAFFLTVLFVLTVKTARFLILSR